MRLQHLFLLALLPALLSAEPCPPGSSARWALDGSLTSDCGGPALTLAGKAALSAAPKGWPGQKRWAGPFGPGQALMADPAGLVDPKQGSLELLVCPKDFSIQSTLFSLNGAGEAYRWLSLYLYQGNLYFYSPSLGATLIAPLRAGTAYRVGVNWSPAGVTLWLGLAADGATKLKELTKALPLAMPTQLTLGGAKELGEGDNFRGSLAQVVLGRAPRAVFLGLKGAKARPFTPGPAAAGAAPGPVAAGSAAHAAGPAIKPSPTPHALPAPCGPPYPSVFKVREEPLLIPTERYEGGCVVEPNVIKGPDGLFHMTYSSNAFAKNGLLETISLATSADLIHWKKYPGNPILGGGAGGQDGSLGMSFQVFIKGEYRIYYKGPDSSLSYASSQDGYHYRFAGRAIPGNAVVPYCGGALDSAGLVFDGKSWWAIAEVRGNVCPHKPPYMNWLFKSDDGGDSFYPASEKPLESQKPDPKREVLVYAGPRSLVKVGSRYHAWLHIDIPTNLYHSVSNDLFNWRSDKQMTIGYSSHLFGLEACNQAADTSVLEHEGKTYLFFDGTDNTNGTGRIGVAVYDGTLADYDRCKGAKP